MRHMQKVPGHIG